MKIYFGLYITIEYLADGLDAMTLERYDSVNTSVSGETQVEVREAATRWLKALKQVRVLQYSQNQFEKGA